LYQPRVCNFRRNLFDVREVYPPQLTKVPTHVMASAALASAAHAAVRSRVASRCDRFLSPSPRAPPPARAAADDRDASASRASTCPTKISRLTSRSPRRRSGRAPSRASVRARAAPTASISTSPLSDTPADAPSDPLAALQGALVHHAPTGDLVDLGARLSETSPGKVTVVAFMRSFG
jgi:hypothetical protein